MSLEKQLTEKCYYTMFINEHGEMHPIRVLGDAYQEEMQKDIPDLSYIRFAQGEVYFQNKDFETAIFKWGQIINELEPWAKKNTADAYYEMGLLSNAEDLYTSIETDSLTLNTEVALNLFSLYYERGKIDSAVKVIKKTVLSNPDYPQVTEIARKFFEERQDWENAIELAVNEASRTVSPEWFDIVISYVQSGVTKRLSPSYFSHALNVVYTLDTKQFEQLTVALWNSYQTEESHFTWLKEINQLLFSLEVEQNEHWEELSTLFKETYFSLIDGSYLIKELTDLIPDLLSNWIRIAIPAQIVLASAAVLSWNELFPVSIHMNIVSEAEKIISKMDHEIDELEECLKLFEAILIWAEAHDMGENNRLKWMVLQMLDFDTHHLLLTGLSGSGKSTFVNTVSGEDLQDSPTSSVVVFKNHPNLEIYEINNQETIQLDGLSDFQERMDRRRNAMESIIEFKRPSLFLQENQLTIIDTPGLNGNQYEVMKQIHAADTVLFVLDANAPFTAKERGILSQIHDQAPSIPIHFLLNKMDTIANEQETVRIFNETKAEIHSYLPDSKIFAFSSHYDSGQQLSELKEFILSIKNTRNLEDKRLAKLLFFIRTTITELLQKRIDVENQLIESVRWNEEMHMKLTGALNQVKDAESQKAETITRNYRQIKKELQKEITEAVPKMLKDCSSLIKENSDFSKIHLELNSEMNNRIQEYLELTILPKYYSSLQEWIGDTKEEFTQSQQFLDEMADGFNVMYGEERFKLECDFKILDDWRRDTDRMTSRFTLEPVNILLRRTPSQFLLKSAGKLLGALSQNKNMLFNKYKAFIENEDYSETVALVNERFFQQSELFEKALERDISLFFRGPASVVMRAIEEAHTEIETNQDLLGKMNTNPELFRDPLTLFEVRLRQFEWMTVAGKGVQTVY
ncbi:GTP-binding protein [Bacillus sp. MUM 116]|uniref:dynamin family protein n=1 Tax=Bacillus sp. MUM 116 TaxID=1678002 RepID=UPI0008F58A8C|nr:dynamin family protein [Bacillus sp. MUM 116]OIK16286.1 GTP-binding protein [Bacillus sp. MUM 116]